MQQKDIESHQKDIEKYNKKTSKLNKKTSKNTTTKRHRSSTKKTSKQIQQKDINKQQRESTPSLHFRTAAPISSTCSTQRKNAKQNLGRTFNNENLSPSPTAELRPIREFSPHSGASPFPLNSPFRSEFFVPALI